MSFGATTNATYTYDVLNRLTKITDSGNLAVTYAYDAASRLTSRALPNGVTTTYSYDDLDRLTKLKDAKQNTVIADNNYTYNAAGAITQNIDQSGTHSYSYDVLDRLTAATYTGTPNESYGYDGVGNRTTSHKSATYGYQPFNRLTATATASYLYDNERHHAVRLGFREQVDASGHARERKCELQVRCPWPSRPARSQRWGFDELYLRWTGCREGHQ